MKKITFLILLLAGVNLVSNACTIVSGVDKSGNTWAMNNEDFPHTYTNYLNVFPTTKTTLGYITFTYGVPNGNIQGGANEAGLFFDYNGLKTSDYKLKKGKKPFEGDMGLYLLQHCKSVPEFLKVWETYYDEEMQSSQMHLADKFGNLAVITPDTIIISNKHLTSTNFNLCGDEKGKSACYRYPIAEKQIADNGVSFKTFLTIAKATAPNGFTNTLYTNIHNLSTGDITLYFAVDYEQPWKTNIHKLIKGGEQHILLASKFPKNHGLQLMRFIDKGNNADNVNDFLIRSKFSTAEKERMLRQNFINYFYLENDFAKARIAFTNWSKYAYSNEKNDTVAVEIQNALSLSSLGNFDDAIACLNKISGSSKKKDILLNELQGIDNTENNVIFKLEGFESAKVVLMEINGDYGFFHVLTKTSDEWLLKMNTSETSVTYCFYVDGKRVLNSTQPIIKNQETWKGDYADFNILKL